MPHPFAQRGRLGRGNTLFNTVFILKTAELMNSKKCQEFESPGRVAQW